MEGSAAFPIKLTPSLRAACTGGNQRGNCGLHAQRSTAGGYFSKNYLTGALNEPLL